MRKLRKRFACALALTLTGCATAPSLHLEEGFSAVSAFSAMSPKAFNPSLPRGEKERQAVLFSYLPIDDPLEYHIPPYTRALLNTTSARIYNVALTDAMGPDNTFFHLFGEKKDLSTQSAEKELTTNDPAVLASSLAWAYSRYPAKLKAFSFLGHGGGFMGISSDLTAGKGGEARVGQLMRLDEFSGALRQGLKGRKLNLIHLHACLMANLEAAYELRDLAQVLFASEDSVGEQETGTEKAAEMLNTLLQSETDPRVIGREVVIRLQPKQETYGYSAATALDLEKIVEVKRAMNTLSQSLIQALPRHEEAIRAALDAVPEFRDYPDSGQRDLWTLCNRLYQGVPDKAVRQAALEVKARLRQALLHARDNQGEAVNGLSIYLPRAGDAAARMNAQNYGKTRFAHDTLWDEFLGALE